jgi:hypothetical protein
MVHEIDPMPAAITMFKYMVLRAAIAGKHTGSVVPFRGTLADAVAGRGEGRIVSSREVVPTEC